MFSTEQAAAPASKLSTVLNFIAVPSSLLKGVGIVAVRNQNERVALEMLIMKYRLLARRVTAEQFLEQAQAKIAELEKKLRQIDE